MISQSLWIVLVLRALACAASSDDVCSSEGENSCSVWTKSSVLELLTGEHQEREVVSGSEDIYVSIKTTQKYHTTRLPPVLFTWLQTINPQQVPTCTSKIEY